MQLWPQQGIWASAYLHHSCHQERLQITIAVVDWELFCNFARQRVIAENLLKEFGEIHDSVGFGGVAVACGLEDTGKFLQLRQDGFIYWHIRVRLFTAYRTFKHPFV